MSGSTIIELPGKGLTDLGAAQVNKAVQRYDKFLRFGYNGANDDYILYVLMPRGFDAAYYIEGEPAYPVIGFGRELPSVDHVMKRVHMADVRKRGQDVYNALLRHNDELKRKNDLIAAATVSEAAERIEHFTRKAGLTEKYGKVAMHIPKSRNAR